MNSPMIGVAIGRSMAMKSRRLRPRPKKPPDKSDITRRRTRAPRSGETRSCPRAATRRESQAMPKGLGDDVQPLERPRSGSLMGLRDGAMQEPVTASTVPEQRLAEAQRIARVGSWSWDVLSDSVTWSDQLFRNYGLEARTGPASVAAYLERVHPSDRERVERAIAGTIATLTPYEHEYRIVHPDGEVRVMHARGEVTRRSGDTVLQLTGYCQDVTERWTAEEKRRHAQRELAGHQMVLARIARGEPLKATLDLLCREIEASYPGTLCSVLM